MCVAMISVRDTLILRYTEVGYTEQELSSKSGLKSSQGGQLHRNNIEGEKRVEVEILNITNIEGIKKLANMTEDWAEVGRNSEQNFKKVINCI